MTLVKLNNRRWGNTVSGLVDELLKDLPVFPKDIYPSGSELTPVNIRETQDSFVMEIIAPGFQKSDFSVSLDGDILTISAERKSESKNEISKTIRNEYQYRNFKRSFTIDEKIDATRIDASYINGVLTLNLPRNADVKTQATEIKIN